MPMPMPRSSPPKGLSSFERGGRFRVDDVQKRAGDVFAHVGQMVSGSAGAGDLAERVCAYFPGQRPGGDALAAFVAAVHAPPG